MGQPNKIAIATRGYRCNGKPTKVAIATYGYRCLEPIADFGAGGAARGLVEPRRQYKTRERPYTRQPLITLPPEDVIDAELAVLAVIAIQEYYE